MIAAAIPSLWIGGGSGPTWLTGPGGLRAGLDPTGATAGALFGGVLKGLGRAIERWILSGTAHLVEACGRAIQATTTPSFGAAFEGEAHVLAHLGAVLALILLFFAVIQAILRQDVSGLLRSVLLRLPAAVLLGCAAAELVALGLHATNEMSRVVMGRPGTAVDGLVQHIAGLLAGSGPHSVLDTGFAGLVVAVVVAAVAFVLWLELVVRSAAILVATLFLPLALAGLVWQESTRWARRLAETLLALVLSKLVVVAVLVLAARTAEHASGLGGLVQALALLLLATLSPFSLLRLVPMVEAGAVGHLDGVGRRAAGRAAGVAVRTGATIRARAAERSGGVGTGVPMAEGVRWDHPSVVAAIGSAPAAGASGPVDPGGGGEPS